VLIIPAIDIKNGKCVRLLQGDPARETIYSDNPVYMARRFEDAGARLIHVVDLDGAFQGRPVNKDLVAAIIKSVKIPIEIGGGIRTAEAVSGYFDLGIRRIIVGTVIFQDFFKNLIDKHGTIIIAGIDAKDSLVATEGWKNVTAVHAIDVIRDLFHKGIREVIYTDISTDGMLTGPNMRAIEHILEEVRGIELIASGGIASMGDIEKLYALEKMGVRGCIVGKAIYDGRIDLKKAISTFV
jgi:phosphoribosylformimino-5-aminoimidazole carboxamide ribotide isomerase